MTKQQMLIRVMVERDSVHLPALMEMMPGDTEIERLDDGRIWVPVREGRDGGDANGMFYQLDLENLPGVLKIRFYIPYEF